MYKMKGKIKINNLMIRHLKLVLLLSLVSLKNLRDLQWFYSKFKNSRNIIPKFPSKLKPNISKVFWRFLKGGGGKQLQISFQDTPLYLKYNSPCLLCPLILDDNKDYWE